MSNRLEGFKGKAIIIGLGNDTTQSVNYRRLWELSQTEDVPFVKARIFWPKSPERESWFGKNVYTFNFILGDIRKDLKARIKRRNLGVGKGPRLQGNICKAGLHKRRWQLLNNTMYKLQGKRLTQSERWQQADFDEIWKTDTFRTKQEGYPS